MNLTLNCDGLQLEATRSVVKDPFQMLLADCWLLGTSLSLESWKGI